MSSDLLQTAQNIFFGLAPVFLIVIGITFAIAALRVIVQRVSDAFPTASQSLPTTELFDATATDDAAEKPKRKRVAPEDAVILEELYQFDLKAKRKRISH